MGVADVLGSDHAPHTREEKARPYPASPSGMPGVQTLVPVMLTHVAEGRLTLERFVDLTSHGPQRIFGLADKGRMAEGFDADLTLVDLKARRMIRHEDMATRSGWTPFDGFEAKGWPVATIIRGRTVMRDGEVVAEGAGRAGAVSGDAGGVAAGAELPALRPLRQPASPSATSPAHRAWEERKARFLLPRPS